MSAFEDRTRGLILSSTRRHRSPFFQRYHVHGEPVMEISREFSSTGLINAVLQEASVSRQAFVETGSIKMNLQLQTLSEFVLKPIRRGTFKQKKPTEMVSIVMTAIERQQWCMMRQTEIMSSLVKSLS